MGVSTSPGSSARAGKVFSACAQADCTPPPRARLMLRSAAEAYLPGDCTPHSVRSSIVLVAWHCVPWRLGGLVEMGQGFRYKKLGLYSLILLLGAAAVAPAQTLARRGWVGSGMTIEPWWKNAVFYQVQPRGVQGSGDADGISLSYLASLGVDAIVVSPPGQPAAGAGGGDESFDRLEQEAGLHKIRVIVDLPLSGKTSTEDTLNLARFWLSRGVAGLRLVAVPDDPALASLSMADRAERLRGLRRLCAAYVGERVLLWDIPAAPLAQKPHGKDAADAPQLAVDHALADLKQWDQGGLRAYLNEAGNQDELGKLIVSDATGRPPSATRLRPAGPLTAEEALGAEKTVAAAVFLGRETPMLFAGQEIGVSDSAVSTAPKDGVDPASLVNWYRKLSGLVHTTAALHGGTVTMVDTGYPDVVAWVRKSTTGREAPVLAVCNLSRGAVVISLSEPLKHLNLQASSGIEPLAVSYAGNPAFTATGISLPAYGVYVGKLIKPGLEDAPTPAIRHKSGR